MKTKSIAIENKVRRLHFIWLFSLVFLLFTTINPSFSQNSVRDVSSINVDDLSDAQVMQMLQQAQAAGLTDRQLVEQAQNRGMSSAQATKLQARIAAIRNNNHTGESADTSTQRRLNYQPEKADSSESRKDIFASLRPKIFGADLFQNRNGSFEPNLKLATPVNYILGPEDQLSISVYGNSIANWRLDVSPEGNINIPGAGVLNVAGKTIEQATASIKNKLIANHYAIGHGTSVQVSLGNIRSIKVIMVGQLVKPGTYTLPSLASVFNALSAAGGPNRARYPLGWRPNRRASRTLAWGCQAAD